MKVQRHAHTSTWRRHMYFTVSCSRTIPSDKRQVSEHFVNVVCLFELLMNHDSCLYLIFLYSYWFLCCLFLFPCHCSKLKVEIFSIYRFILFISQLFGAMICAVRGDRDTSITEILSWHGYCSLHWVAMLELPSSAHWALHGAMLSKLEILFCLLVVQRKLLQKHRSMWSCLIRHWLSICKKKWLGWRVS